MITPLKDYFIEQQSLITTTFGDLDQEDFKYYPKDHAHHQSLVAVIEGTVIEKGAVNVSYINGQTMPAAASKRRPECAGLPFKVTGLSMILHPTNPHAPTMHANLRAFSGGPNYSINWIGGGMDLTPCYGYPEDAILWHQTIHHHMSPFGEDLYATYKKQCDDYFYLPHRHEWRGIGGVFFDDLSWPEDQSFSFIKAMSECIIKAYTPILNKRMQMPYTESEKSFQSYRRGRYVEFNLLHDRGTKFGLEYGSDADQILVSLPKFARWSYDYPIKPGSPEAKLATFLTPKDWLHANQERTLT